jgi:hypothetical protein
VIGVLKPWLEADPLCKVKFWYVLSFQQWDLYGEVHKYMTDARKRTTVVPSMRATLNFCREYSTAQNLNCWDSQFNNRNYKGHSFYNLFSKKLEKWLRPSYLKGGKWLEAFGLDVWLCARASRAILNYAPTGKYHRCFYLKEHQSNLCQCRTGGQLGLGPVLETRQHIITSCNFIKYHNDKVPRLRRHLPPSVESFLDFLKLNPQTFAFKV